MKILLIGTMYPPYIQGGAEVVLHSLAKGLVGNGHEVAVLSLTPEKRFSREVVDGVTILRHEIPNIYWPFAAAKPHKYTRMHWHVNDVYNRESLKIVRNTILEYAPDVVNTHNLAGWSISVWDAVKESKTPLVHVVHDFYLACANSNMFKHMRICKKQCASCGLLRYRHKKASGNVDVVVGVSKFILDRHCQLGYFNAVGKQTYIHNARNMQEVIAARSEQKDAKLRFGFIGAITPSKGIELLLEVYSQLAPSNTELVIAGRGEDRYVESLKSRYSSTNISFIGHAKPADFYSRIDVLVVPSLSNEAMGMVVPEAFANGIPVIASMRGGIPEIVEHGVSGFLFEPDRRGALEEQIMQFLRTPSLVASMREATVHAAVHFQQVGQWIRQYEDAYSSAIAACHA